MREVGVGKKRLWIVCAKPGRDDDELTSLSVTSRDSYPNPDLSCPVNVGEHGWVVKPSIIFYRQPVTDTPLSLQRRVALGSAEPQDSAGDDLIRRIRDGVFLSRFSPPSLKDAISECAWAPR